jgi:hypothetical protein
MAIAGQLLIELGANVARLQHDLTRARRDITAFATDTKKIFGGLAGVFGGVQLANVFKDFVKEAAEAEKQERKLAAALRIRGVESQKVLDILKEQAKRMQDTSIFSDDEIIRAMRFATNLGVIPSKLQPVLDMSTKISRLYDLELNDAIKKVSMSLEGAGRGFREIDPQLTKHLTQLKTWEERYKLIAERFEADMPKLGTTYADQVKMFDNQWKEFGETLGSIVLPSLTKLFAIMTTGMKEIQKNPLAFMPGEFASFEDMFPTVKDLPTDFTAILKEADKRFKKTAAAPDIGKANTYAKTMARLQKEIEEQQAISGWHTVEDVRKQAEAKWSIYKEAGIRRQDFDILVTETVLAHERKRQADLVKLNYEGQVKIFEDTKWLKEEFWAYESEMGERRYEEMLRYESELLSMTQRINDEVRSALSEMGGSELSKLLKTVEEQSAGTDIYSQREVAAYEHYQKMQELYLFDSENKQKIDEAYFNWVAKTEQTRYDQMAKLGVGYFATASQLMQNLYQMGGQKSKALYNLFKAFKIAETIISTVAGSMKTYDAVLKETDNVYVAAAAAAAYTAFGMTQVATIASTEPGGQGGGGAGSSYSPPVSATTPAAERQPEAIPGSVMNIYVYGSIVDHDGFARDIIPYLMKAQSDGVQ